MSSVGRHHALKRPGVVPTPRSTPAGRRGSRRRASSGGSGGSSSRVPVVVVLAAGGGLVYAYSQIELPKTLPPIQSTFMYDRNGSLLASIHGAVDRTIIPFDQMPESLRDAVIAVEDHGFYDHPGIDPVGILRAAWTDLVKHETVQGGSTITQQLVKTGLRRQLRGAAGRHAGVRGAARARSRRRSARRSWRSSSSRRSSKDRDPGALPQHHLPRARRVRRAGGRADVLGHRRADLSVEAVRHARRPHHVAEPVRPDRPPRGLEGRVATTRSTRWCTTATSIRRRRTQLEGGEGARPTERAEVINAPANSEYFVDYTKRYLIDKYGEPGGLRRRPAGDDLARPRAAARRGGGRERAPAEPVGSGGGAGRDRPADRRDPRDGRRPRLQELAGEPGGLRAATRTETFGGTGRQAGSSFKPFTLAAAMQAGYDLNARWHGPGHDHDPEHRLLHERRAVAAVERVGLRGGLLLAAVRRRRTP